MTENIETGVPNESRFRKIKGFFAKFNLPEKYSKFVDNLILLISIWASFVIIAIFNNKIPNPDWPFYLDRVLLFVFFLALSYITLRLLRPVIFVGIIAGLIYLAITLFLSEFEEARDPRKTEVKQTIELKSARPTILNDLFPFLSNNDSANFKLSNIQREIILLRKEMDSLNQVLKNKNLLQQDSNKTKK
jgi:hypothetical protein